MGKKKKKKSTAATVVGTAQPTGLTISRSGGAFTCSWNIGDSDYGDGQIFAWDLNGVRQGSWGVATTATSQPLTLDLNQRINSITFWVQGNKKKYTAKKKKKTITYEPGWSAWSGYTLTLSAPNPPTVSYALDSSDANKGTFSWSIDGVDDTNNAPFLRYEWESILVDKWNSTNPPTDWSQAEKGSGATTSYSWTKTEDAALFNDPDYSWARWFRVRSVGPAGASDWRYAHHVYAVPRQAYDVTAKAIPRAGDSGYSVVSEWIAPESIPYPIENDIINYAIIKPRTVAKAVGNVMVTTMDYPAESPSWTQANTVADTPDKDAFTFSIPEILQADECIFVKIDTKHDSHVTQGIPVLAEGGTSYLENPKVNTIIPNPGTYRVVVKASNNSDLEASFLAIYYRTEESPDTYQVIGIMKKSEEQVTVQCPNWGDKEFSIGVQALLADYSPVERSSTGVTEYTISNIKMKSEILWDEGRVPMPPKYVELSAPNSTTIRVMWDWTWTEANKTELSWSDHDDAWESTDQPQTYEVTDLFTGAWNIAGVSVGTWYVRARLIQENGDSVKYGLYSDTKMIKLSSAPAIPSLILSNGVVSEDGEVTCYWAYVSTDGTGQMQADICEATYDEEQSKYTYGDIIDRTSSAQHITIPIEKLGWKAGETHYLAVRVISVSGEQSQGWSAPVPIKVAEPLTVAIENTSLVEKTFDVIDGITRTDLSLAEIPLTFTLNSKGGANKITALIERAKDFHMRRPDESNVDGYEGEIIATKTFDGDGTYSIELNDLIGHLDDNASYRLVAIAKDTYGQSAECSIEFVVHWDHQALVPSAQCEMDTDYYAAILTPLLPEGYTKQEGDVCDIYRLSVDAPELIYKNAEFGEKYVDPYPTIGEFGGHRFVFKTKNGDYTTEDNHIAWYDTTADENDYLDIFTVLIDYNGEQISLPYNVSFSNRWAKDFKQTNYLGGSIQGDWNPAVSRTGSISTVGVIDEEDDTDGTIESVRRLAVYPGICHVRTPDGSSYSANINVSEDREEKMTTKLAKYSLEITAVDSQELDGVTFERWQEMTEEEEE